jgi:hypothetical protein
MFARCHGSLYGALKVTWFWSNEPAHEMQLVTLTMASREFSDLRQRMSPLPCQHNAFIPELL